MAPTYRECPACGKHALRIATRCPRCGHELLTTTLQPPVKRAATGWSRLVLVGAMVLAGLGLAMAATKRHDGPSPSLWLPAPATPPPSPTPPAAATTDPWESPVPPDSMPSPGAVPRVAKTWTKVHDRRSVNGDLTAVLLPGDTVLVDSLRGRWWRVALEGRVIGYVYAGTLVGE